jgi:hypothetical protein
MRMVVGVVEHYRITIQEQPMTTDDAPLESLGVVQKRQRGDLGNGP